MEKTTNGLSKSRYTLFRQCPDILWFKVFKPEEEVLEQDKEDRFEKGRQIGELAKSLFGSYADATICKSDGSLDLSGMAEKTIELMANPQIQVICEAAFLKDNHYCAVDLLRRVEDGWSIYEVKSASSFSKHKDAYIPDVAYQKWLLQECGVNVKGSFLVHINPNYVFDGNLNLQDFFSIVDMDEMISEELIMVPDQVKLAEQTLQKEEPSCQIGTHCKKPYECPFKDYCYNLHGIPYPEHDVQSPRIQSIFELNGQSIKQPSLLKYYRNGQISLESIKDEKLSENVKIQVECTLQDKVHVNKENLSKFLNELSFPLYFLDFETFAPIVPLYEGTTPYQQIPFQYSLHWIDEKNSSAHHTEFLAESDIEDPRRRLAEKLCKDIPCDRCVLAYNMSTEKGIIEKLAGLYPDLSDHLLNIAGNIRDLYLPFKNYDYYSPAMRGKTSIKVVLPTMFPEDPELNYHNLQGGIQNGVDAKNIFPNIRYMEENEAKKAREALLAYCKLDTLATVKVWQKLNEIVAD